MKTTIEFCNVTKQFGNVTAVNDVSFEIRDEELLALLGPSGSGKTTTLRLLAGFENPTNGEILLNDETVNKYPPHKRDMGMVFQDYALFPHMNVRENIAFGIKRKHNMGEEIDQRITEVLEMVDLAGYQDRKPDELSGGQQQRIATARAVAFEPQVLLMDEPLGALDKKLRDQLQIEIAELQKQLNTTTVYVTHNQEEAMAIADRIAIMNEGEIEQIGTPTEVYYEPETRFVADFIGDTNFLSDEIVRQNGTLQVRYNGEIIDVGASNGPSRGSTVFVRPESMTIPTGEDKGSYDNSIEATVETITFMGSKTQYQVRVGDDLMTIEDRDVKPDAIAEGDAVTVAWQTEDTKIVEV
jgi:spermidine/putrescine ABC transporter ATP-binding subunit